MNSSLRLSWKKGKYLYLVHGVSLNPWHDFIYAYIYICIYIYMTHVMHLNNKIFVFFNIQPIYHFSCHGSNPKCECEQFQTISFHVFPWVQIWLYPFQSALKLTIATSKLVSWCIVTFQLVVIFIWNLLTRQIVSLSKRPYIGIWID